MSFSGSEVAIITALLGAVVGALTFLFRMLMAEKDKSSTAKDREIERLEGQNKVLLDAVLTSSKAVENTTTVLAKQRTTR